jgi:hypothetical protein
MLKSALAGAFALAFIGCLPVAYGGFGVTQAAAQEMASVQETTGSVGGVVVTESKIAHLKHALRLTPEQEVHWHPVEASLRRLMQAARRDGNAGMVQRVRAKVSGYVVSAAALQHVASAAGPLIATLDDQQRQDGLKLIREIGVGGQ